MAKGNEKGGAEALRRIVMLDGLDHLADAGHHPVEVDAGKVELRQAEVPGTADHGDTLLRK